MSEEAGAVAVALAGVGLLPFLPGEADGVAGPDPLNTTGTGQGDLGSGPFLGGG